MKVLITGSSGMVGTALVEHLEAGGQEVLRLVRQASDDPACRFWDPDREILHTSTFERFDAVIHLAGANIAAGRWTAARKQVIRSSRVRSTALLATALARSPAPPQVLLCASAIGIYGDRGTEELTEASEPGTGFLAEVGREWEAAARPARAAGIRVVHLRFGVILGRRGGALAKMLPPFRCGLGGTVGGGKQYWSWVSHTDVLRAVGFALKTPVLEGAVNVVAPGSVTNRDFTRILGRVLRRPTPVPLPAFAVRLLFGEMGEAALLASARVRPRRLEEAGFQFTHPDLETALRAELAR